MSLASAGLLWRDDNTRTINTPAGLRPQAGTANIISATLSASTQELTLPAASAIGSIVRIYGGSQGVFYAFDAAGQSASYTGITNMIALPANAVEYVQIRSTDAKVYALQLGTAGTFQVALMK